MKKLSSKIPFVNALFWIVVSTFFCSGIAYSLFNTYFKYERKKFADPKYRITSIIQTGPERGALMTDYLAELMNISVDRPMTIFSFDVQKARKNLLNSPVIKEVEVKKIPPATIYIEYTVRQPIAWISDFENMAIDEEGFLFPVSPFFSPKNLPQIYLGSAVFEIPSFNLQTFWHKPLKGPYIELAFNLLKFFKEADLNEKIGLRRIDVSKAYEENYGIREVVLLCEDEISQKKDGKEVFFILPRLLRLSTKDCSQEIGNYLKLRDVLLKQEIKELKIPFPELKNEATKIRTNPKTIDFRISHLAFIKSATSEREKAD